LSSFSFFQLFHAALSDHFAALLQAPFTAPTYFTRTRLTSVKIAAAVYSTYDPGADSTRLMLESIVGEYPRRYWKSEPASCGGKAVASRKKNWRSERASAGGKAVIF